MKTEVRAILGTVVKTGERIGDSLCERTRITTVCPRMPAINSEGAKHGDVDDITDQ